MAKPYVLSRFIHEILELDRLDFLSDLVKRYGGRDFTQRSMDISCKRASAYLMGGTGKAITHLYKCSNKYGGCCYMPTIIRTDFASGINYFARNNVSFMGIVRVGQFHSDYLGAIGDGIINLCDFLQKKILLLSFGRNGMTLQQVDCEMKPKKQKMVLEDSL